jgi:hypothetical protein
MNRFIRWYQCYYTEITWFIIGWLVMDLLNNLGKEQYTDALIDLGIVALNFVFWRQRH